MNYDKINNEKAINNKGKSLKILRAVFAIKCDTVQKIVNVTIKI